MVNSLRLQILIDIDTYNKVIAQFKEEKKHFKNDSERIRYIIHYFLQVKDKIELDLYRYKTLLDDKNRLITELSAMKDGLLGERINLFKQIDIYKMQIKQFNKKLGEIKNVKKKIKTKQGKKKSK